MIINQQHKTVLMHGASCLPRRGNNRFILNTPITLNAIICSTTAKENKEKNLQLCHHDRLYPQANGGGCKEEYHRQKQKR